MRSLNEYQKNQLINRSWWEFIDEWNYLPLHKHIEKQIFATREYKRQLKKRYFNS